MSYEVIFDPGAAREFDKLPRAHREGIASVLDGLAEEPRPPGARKLTGVEAYRMRVGDCRIVYAVKRERLIILVLKVGDRRDVYKDIETIRRRLAR
jgi:mRNA interferase RelE/StbE